jgi:hypothetical protein
LGGENKSNKNGGAFMSKNMLTTKEATLISDLMTMEEAACKKARLYSRILTDATLAKEFSKIADNHEKRFNALFDLL